MVTIGDLEEEFHDPRVRAYLAGLDLDPNETLTMFTLMDTDSSGTLSYDEFLTGVMKMKGHAKGVDIFTLMYDHRNFEDYITRFVDHVELQLSEIRKVVDPSAPAKSMELKAGVHSSLARRSVRKSSMVTDRLQARTSFVGLLPSGF
jgi:hypothetical protein